jgi:Cu-Zn family superoxide dismutase
MDYRTNFSGPRPQALKILLLLAVALLAAGCGSADDEEPGLTNVEPREAVRSPGEPEVPVPEPDETTPMPAIGGEATPDDMLLPVDKQLYAVATIDPASGSSVSGELRLREDGERVYITGTVEGLAPGEHGLHIHTVGDCSAPDASSAGGHFDPQDDSHGSPDESIGRHHLGDLGNITADASGIAEVNKEDAEMSLETGENSILGRAVVVHAEADDFVSQPSGAAGARIGCGVIELDVSPAYEGEKGL